MVCSSFTKCQESLSIWPKNSLTLITQIHNMLSGVCSGSNHTHQIQFITNIEDHNKTLRKYCEMVKNNHEHSESTSKFISHDCFQLYCWPPQNRAQPAFSFSWRISATIGKPFSDQVIELKILTYFGC